MHPNIEASLFLQLPHSSGLLHTQCPDQSDCSLVVLVLLKPRLHPTAGQTMHPAQYDARGFLQPSPQHKTLQARSLEKSGQVVPLKSGKVLEVQHRDVARLIA